MSSVLENKLHKLVDQAYSAYYLTRLRKDQGRPTRELEAMQWKRARYIIKHAYNYVPYYHRLFSSANVKPEDIRTREDLKRIPLTSKKDLQKNRHDAICRGVEESKCPHRITSGSTGIPLQVCSGHPEISYIIATEKYPFLECGVKLGDNFVTVWGRGSGSISWSNKYVRLWGDITTTIVPLLPPEKLIEVLRYINPDVLHTFPSVISTLADYDTSGINPKLVLTQGEVVTEHCRDVVKNALNSELFETYGSVEFGQLAFECKEHSGLHMITDGALMEFVDEKYEFVSPGEEGEIIVTGLYGRIMPLIRYRIGDIGTFSDEKCPCGRTWPLIKNIEGRINDFLVLPSGKKLSWLYLLRLVLYDQAFQENLLSILQYQIVQEQKSKVIFKIVKERNFNTAILTRIKSNLEKYFADMGENLEIVMEIVDEIPRERTGKRRILISMLSQKGVDGDCT